MATAPPGRIPGIPRPENEQVLRIRSDTAGISNTARACWSNKQSNLVNDQPGEAELNPKGFGRFALAS